MKLAENGISKIEALDGAAKDMGMRILKKWLLDGSITQPAAQWFKDLGVLELGSTGEISLKQMEQALKGQDGDKPFQLFDFYRRNDDREDKRNFWIVMNDLEVYGRSKLGAEAVRTINVILPDSVLKYAMMSSNFVSVEDGAFPAVLDFRGQIVEKVGELSSGVFSFFLSTDGKGYADYANGEYAVISIR